MGDSNDLQFARRLLRIPLADRLDWLTAKARKFVDRKNGDVAELVKIIEPLYKIDWEGLTNDRK